MNAHCEQFQTKRGETVPRDRERETVMDKSPY